MALDKIDLQLIDLLQHDSKQTSKQLSIQLNLSITAIYERVKKLETSGVIESYHAQINDTLLGIGIKAFISISLERQKVDSIVTFKEKIQAIPEIIECYQVTGNADYFLKVVVKDIPSFESLISNKLSQIEEIGQMQTMMILSKAKDSKVIPFEID